MHALPSLPTIIEAMRELADDLRRTAAAEVVGVVVDFSEPVTLTAGDPQPPNVLLFEARDPHRTLDESAEDSLCFVITVAQG